MLADFGDGFILRQATANDHAALRMVCLKTGDSGQDATAREDDPDLLGDIYAVPYQIYAPDFAFVVDGPDGVCGYVLGAPDSAAFYAAARAGWFAERARALRDPGPDKTRWRGSDWARWEIHHPQFFYPPILHRWPAHGHIDLLPSAQGRRIGTRAMRVLMERLAAAGVTGLHLGVSPTNAGALAFYPTLGFRRLDDPAMTGDAVVMVRELP